MCNMIRSIDANKSISRCDVDQTSTLDILFGLLKKINTLSISTARQDANGLPCSREVLDELSTVRHYFTDVFANRVTTLIPGWSKSNAKQAGEDKRLRRSTSPPVSDVRFGNSRAPVGWTSPPRTGLTAASGNRPADHVSSGRVYTNCCPMLC